MPRGPSITPRVRELIARVYYEHTDWTAKEVQGEVNALVRKAHLSLKPDWPGLSAVQKELNSLRKSPNPKDRPWDMLTLSEYELPPDTLPTVLQAWVHTTLNSSRPLTIREAKWVARLHSVIKDIGQLTKVARSYAFWEYVSERYGPRYVYPTADYKLYETMTGRDLSEEQRDKLLDERLKDLWKTFRNMKWWTEEDVSRARKRLTDKSLTNDRKRQMSDLIKSNWREVDDWWA
ncbi:hypothetical protein ES707_18404 [subsurface metagenome]